MKKYLVALLSVVMLAGCGTASDAASADVQPAEDVNEVVEEVQEAVEEVKEEVTLSGEPLTILSPSGAPSLSLLPVIEDGLADVEIVDGADPLQAAFVNPEPQYDLIIAPSNLGMKLASAGKTTYKLLGIVTWGNLYIVAKDGIELDPSSWEKIASFGEQSVTGIVFNDVFGEELSEDQIIWYNSTAEASAALLSDEVDVAMLAEPNVTASIAKAKQNDVTLNIIGDLQQLYAGASGLGFPQAAIYVQEDVYAEKTEQVDALFETMSSFSNEASSMDAAVLELLIDTTGGAERFGVPSSTIVSKAWNRMNIHVEPAGSHLDDLEQFGTLFGIDDISNALLN